AQRVVALLQEVFESTFSYDLEGLNKKGLKQAAKQIGRYQAADDYTVAWVTQQSLGGHAIPVDAPTLRTAGRLGLTDGEADPEADRLRMVGLGRSAPSTHPTALFGGVTMTAALALLILAADPTPPPPDPDASRQLVREALTVYGMGVLHQRQDRLVEAVRSLE